MSTQAGAWGPAEEPRPVLVEESLQARTELGLWPWVASLHVLDCTV